MAALDGSVAAPLVDCCVWTGFHTGLVLFIILQSKVIVFSLFVCVCVCVCVSVCVCFRVSALK